MWNKTEAPFLGVHQRWNFWHIQTSNAGNKTVFLKSFFKSNLNGCPDLKGKDKSVVFNSSMEQQNYIKC